MNFLKMNFLKQRRLNRLERKVVTAAKRWNGTFKKYCDFADAEASLGRAVENLIRLEEESEE